MSDRAPENGSGQLAALQDQPPRVSVVGAGDASAEELARAEALGRVLGEAGAIVITGGLGGVMEAASRGCAQGGGLTIGFLPGEDPATANQWVRVPLATGLGEARNVLVVRSGEVVVAVGGGWGTLSEVALARKMGRDVALLGSTSVALPLPMILDPSEAAAWALGQVWSLRRLKSTSPSDTGTPRTGTPDSQ